MGRVNRQRRQDWKHLFKKEIAKEFDIVIPQIIAGQDVDACVRHLGDKGAVNRLLAVHQRAGVHVDQAQLFRRRQPVKAGGRVARMGQFAQASHAHGIKFIKVGRRNRQEPQAFQQRHPGIFRLFEHAHVEADPRQLSVHKAVCGGQIKVECHRVRAGTI